MAEPELRNCPFCGSKENAIKEHWMCRNMWYVQCYGCGCNSACFRTTEEAVEAWNTRYLSEYIVKLTEPPKE